MGALSFVFGRTGLKASVGVLKGHAFRRAVIAKLHSASAAEGTHIPIMNKEPQRLKPGCKTT
jgi:hypothetical protein